MEKGVRRVFWLPNEMDEVVESIRKKLGMSRSAFYRHAVIRLLEEYSMLSSLAHSEDLDQVALEDDELTTDYRGKNK